MASDIQYCSECGSQNSGDAVFCSSCGQKFTSPSSKLGDTSTSSQTSDFQPVNNQSSQYSSPQQANQNLNFPPQGQVNGLLDASVKMVTEPKKYAVRLLADPDAPSASYLVYLRALIFAAVTYFTFSRDEYFNAIYAETITEVLEGTDLTLQQAREIYTVSFPVMMIIFILGYWYIGSWILGLLVKGNLHQNSPLTLDVSRSMRQLNGYRQLPRIIAELIALVVVVTFPTSIYFFMVERIIRPIGQIFFALILWRGLGEHVGYFGSIHKVIAGVIIVFEVLSFA